MIEEMLGGQHRSDETTRLSKEGGHGFTDRRPRTLVLARAPWRECTGVPREEKKDLLTTAGLVREYRVNQAPYVAPCNFSQYVEIHSYPYPRMDDYEQVPRSPCSNWTGRMFRTSQ